MMRVGIYCGSFAPIHKGHITIVEEILKRDLVDKVLIVPTISYWDKKIIIPLKDRINMCKLYATSSIEIEEELNEVSCSYEGFTKYQEKHPNDELFLILGADNLLKFESWVNYQEMLKYTFIIVKRDDLDGDYINNRMKEFNKNNYFVLDIPTIDISSTYIRENINHPELLKDKIDQKIYDYLKNIYSNPLGDK